MPHRQLKARGGPPGILDLEPAPIMIKIAVVGATGPTGIHLVTGLRKTVASMRVIARSTAHFRNSALAVSDPREIPLFACVRVCRS
jgi:hypothetical protein